MGKISVRKMHVANNYSFETTQAAKPRLVSFYDNKTSLLELQIQMETGLEHTNALYQKGKLAASSEISLVQNCYCSYFDDFLFLVSTHLQN